MAETSKFHSSLAITNVKTLIPITLDLESGQYHSWVALFKVHVKVHNVLEHIIPPTDAKENVVYDKAKVDDLPLLKRLNAAVLQWIYATVSSDILTWPIKLILFIPIKHDYQDLWFTRIIIFGHEKTFSLPNVL